MKTRARAMLRSRFLEVVLCAFVISAGCSKEPAAYQLRDLPVVAFIEQTSFIDFGLKAIVFPRGVAFVMRLGSGGLVFEKVTLPTAHQQLLLDALNQNHFFGLPLRMESHACDGSSFRVLCADPHREHWVYSGGSDDPDFLAFRLVFEDLVSVSADSAVDITASDFITGIAGEMEAFPMGSTLRNAAATFLDYMVRSRLPAFWGVGDTARFTLPGKQPKVYRDLPSEDPALLENERRLMEKERKAERRAGQEASIAECGLLPDLPPSVVDNLLPEPAPIVIDLPVLD